MITTRLEKSFLIFGVHRQSDRYRVVCGERGRYVLRGSVLKALRPISLMISHEFQIYKYKLLSDHLCGDDQWIP